jgi:hypothetical protein
MQNDKEKIAIRKKTRGILPFSTKKHAIFSVEKLRFSSEKGVNRNGLCARCIAGQKLPPVFVTNR